MNFKPKKDYLQVGAVKFDHVPYENPLNPSDKKHIFSSNSNNQPFSMTASMTGVKMEGTYEIHTMQDLQDFAALLSEVWRARKSLELKLASTLSGH